MKTIKADVLYNWDHVANKGCKFLPKDLVKINHIPRWQSQLANSYAGQVGTVIAVSSGAPGLIRGDYRRQFTRYYVEMQDGEIIGTHSHYLTKAGEAAVDVPRLVRVILDNPNGYNNYQGTVKRVFMQGNQEWADIEWDMPVHPCTTPMQTKHLIQANAEVCHGANNQKGNDHE